MVVMMDLVEEEVQQISAFTMIHLKVESLWQLVDLELLTHVKVRLEVV
mgnify:CR=1 FL=1